MLKRIKEINPLSAAETFGFFSSFIGFLIGIIYSLLLLLKININLELNFFYEFVKSLKLEYFSILIFPIVYMITGFILGGFLSFLYNIAAKLSNNGIEIDLME